MNTNDKPAFQEFHIAGVKHIAPEEALELLENNEAVLIDVRESNEVTIENFVAPNILYHPISVIMERLAYIAKDLFIIVACTGGVSSTKVVNLLNMQGYPNVANLDGGLMMWKMKGLPFDSKLQSCSGCGCSCK